MLLEDDDELLEELEPDELELDELLEEPDEELVVDEPDEEVFSFLIANLAEV